MAFSGQPCSVPSPREGGCACGVHLGQTPLDQVQRHILPVQEGTAIPIHAEMPTLQLGQSHLIRAPAPRGRLDGQGDLAGMAAGVPNLQDRPARAENGAGDRAGEGLRRQEEQERPYHAPRIEGAVFVSGCNPAPRVPGLRPGADTAGGARASGGAAMDHPLLGLAGPPSGMQ